MVTSSYKNFNPDLYKTYSISGDRGKGVNYKGKCYPKLAPKKGFWKIWHDNIGKISEEENTKYYIEQYYKEVLSRLDPMETYEELKYDVLLCYEEPGEFCHRHIVAEWFNLLLDVKVPEVKCESMGFKEIERPNYYREYLEEVMKKNKNMRGFTSIRALYLFEEGEKLEQQANECERNTGRCCDGVRQAACYLRCDADEAEYEYQVRQKTKQKRK